MVAAQYSAIGRDQKFTRRNPCPICEGGDDDKRHQGIRCHGGFLSDDGRYAFCGNAGYAGRLPAKATTPTTWKHLLGGVCRCGETHGAAIERPPIDIHDRKPHIPNTNRSHTYRTPERIHTYRTADGRDYLRVLRTGTGKDKTFTQQRPDGNGDWYDGLEGLAPILYNLPALLAADPWAPVFICEGEKACDALIERGQLATCNLGGAGKWRNTPQDDRHTPLRGRSLIILPDNDPETPDKPQDSRKGQRHAADAADDLAGVAASVRILELPGLGDKQDVYDWLADGHTTDELRRLAADTQVLLLGSHEARNHAQRGQDDTPTENGKTCADCERLKAALQVAETSLANLRQERAWAKQVMALPKEQLSPALKPAAIAVYDLLKRPRMRDEQGMEQVYRAQIAKQCGISDQTAGAQLRDLAKAGVINRQVTKAFDHSEIRIGEGPMFTTPTAIPVGEATWGGKRVKSCPSCGGENIEVRHTCRDCGTVLKVADLNRAQDDDPTPPDGPQEPTQDDTTPSYPIVNDLAYDGPDAADGNASPTPADTTPDAEYIGADAMPPAQEAHATPAAAQPAEPRPLTPHEAKVLGALANWQATHDGEAPNEREWREVAGYGHQARDVLTFMHIPTALQHAGYVTQDARMRFTLTRQPSARG